GGGTIFGPVPRDYGFKLNKKVKQLARRSALSLRAQNDIAYDKANQTETFHFSIADGISQDGSYAVFSKSKHTGPRAEMNVLNKSGNTLTITHDIHRFANPGETVTFYVAHCIHCLNSDGSIICYKTDSNGINYKTPLYY
ncbi:MAG: 50S ribosomal protein L4, partial [Peptococcaceae bacterium]|nr:50S ribosomal protein L4 [Peptococcaceae bacterium]